MSEPKRVQLRRTAGWCKPEGAVVVSRPSRWGNPFRIGRVWTNVGWNIHVIARGSVYVQWLQDDRDGRQHAVDMFALHIGPMGDYEYDDDTMAILRKRLAGHDLACWCPLDQPCHADVLLELANAS